MSEWLSLETNIWENDKVLSVADAVDEDEALVALSFISVLTYCRANCPDGNLSELGRGPLRRVLRWRGNCPAENVVDAMLECGFLSEGPFRVTNFMAKHKKLLAAQRQRDARDRQRDECVTERDTNVTERDECVTDRDRDIDKEHLNPLPESGDSCGGVPAVLSGYEAVPFGDFWQPYPNKQGKQEAEKRWTCRTRKRMSDRDRQRAVIVACAMAYSVDHGYKDRDKCPYGSTFLNQRRYDEWYDENGTMIVPPGWGIPDLEKRQQRDDAIRRAVEKSAEPREWDD